MKSAYHGVYLRPMFPLSCVRVRAHTRREMSAHKKLGTHINFPLKTVFTHILYMSFYIIQISASKMLHTGNFVHTQTLKN